MNIAVVYHSMSGNTRKVAKAIAQAAGCEAYAAKEYQPSDPADLMFIGGAVYGGKLEPSFDAFLQTLTPTEVKRAAVFCTYVSAKAADLIKERLKEAGIAVEKDSFSCEGRFLIKNWRHPNQAELEEAKAFASGIISSVK